MPIYHYWNVIIRKIELHKEVVLPFSPSFDIVFKSMKWVPITVLFTGSLSRNWILILWHRGGNISVKTICSFQTGA